MEGGLGIDRAALTPLSPLAQGLAARPEQALRDAARGKDGEAALSFQALLGSLLVREMRRALPDGMFGSGPGADAFDSWFDEHLGRALAERDALGLAGMIKVSLARLEESRAAQAAAEDATGPGPEEATE
jgi:Rod binding domain-containing protein